MHGKQIKSRLSCYAVRRYVIDMVTVWNYSQLSEYMNGMNCLMQLIPLNYRMYDDIAATTVM